MSRPTCAAALLLGLFVAFSCSAAEAAEASPIGKVLQMISDLQAKVIKEGEGAQKVYNEFAEWCEEQSKELNFEIKTGKAQVTDSTASIDKDSAKIASLDARLGKLAGELQTDESDLKAAAKIRAKEFEDFSATEKELKETVDTLQRAVGIIEKEMKGGASMLQLQNAGSLARAVAVLLEASKLSTGDARQLTALAQRSAAGDEELGAPAAATYESHSGDILQTLSDLLEDAENQLEAARGKETKNVHAFEMLKQSLEDEIKYGEKEIAEAKDGIAASSESKSKAEGELSVTSKDLKADVKGLSELHHECMTKAEDFEAETKSRGEELAALAKAKEVIKENVGGAEKLSYGLDQVSLLQVARVGAQAQAVQYDAVRLVRALAQKQHSAQLAQLAVKMGASASAAARAGDDPFSKIKGLITDMIEKLEAEAEADATKKAYCDKELAETNEKKADKTAEIEKLTTQIDKMSARSAKLKEEVAELQSALAKLAKSQAEMDKIRAEEKAAHKTNSADMEQGLKGVKLALKVLTEYYAKEDKAHESADGASSGIISLLEVCESDFTKGLAEMTAEEESAQDAYDEQTKENEIEKTTKDQDVKYKTKESTELDKTAAETKSDVAGVQEELDAALEYLKKIEKECIAKAETYEERRARYEAELAGLKEALQTLESETALVQKNSVRRLRTVAPHKGVA